MIAISESHHCVDCGADAAPGFLNRREAEAASLRLRRALWPEHRTLHGAALGVGTRRHDAVGRVLVRRLLGEAHRGAG
jgi:hypothetical protein